jgi:hypothetical protein
MWVLFIVLAVKAEHFGQWGSEPDRSGGILFPVQSALRPSAGIVDFSPFPGKIALSGRRR